MWFSVTLSVCVCVCVCVCMHVMGKVTYTAQFSPYASWQLIVFLYSEVSPPEAYNSCWRCLKQAVCKWLPQSACCVQALCQQQARPQKSSVKQLMLCLTDVRLGGASTQHLPCRYWRFIHQAQLASCVHSWGQTGVLMGPRATHPCDYDQQCVPAQRCMCGHILKPLITS